MHRGKVEILDFNEVNLAKALSNKYLKPENVPSIKRSHFPFLLSYLGDTGLDAKTIVIEYPYISKAYLNDYSAYYSLCFEDYPKECKRVHFFNVKVSRRQFNAAILNPNSDYNKIFKESHYLGHIVAKPLPEAIIGPTLLKTYEDSQERVYVTKRYHINVFGKKVSIRSLVYQEQDTVTGACATTAIWIALHKTFKLFQSASPTPDKITSSAGNLFFSAGRSFPSRGLDIGQIGNAIHSVGLVSEMRDMNSNTIKELDLLKAFIYAYNRMEIPVLMGIKLPGDGLHLIVISGYQTPLKHNKVTQDDSPTLLTSGLTKLYAHDDQTGPFARMEFCQPVGNSPNNLITSWIDPKDSKLSVKAQITDLIVPLNHKIRINFEEVYGQVRKLDLFFSILAINESSISWEIYLDYSNKYKEEIRDEVDDRSLKERILFTPYPKYIWVVKMSYNDVHWCDIIYDSTGIERSFFCRVINFSSRRIIKMFKPIFSIPNFRAAIEEELHLEYTRLFDEALAV